MARLRLKRQLLDALADVTKFASPEGMVEQEFSQIWQRLEADRQPAGWTRTTRTRTKKR